MFGEGERENWERGVTLAPDKKCSKISCLFYLDLCAQQRSLLVKCSKPVRVRYNFVAIFYFNMNYGGTLVVMLLARELQTALICMSL